MGLYLGTHHRQSPSDAATADGRRAVCGSRSIAAANRCRKTEKFSAGQGGGLRGAKFCQTVLQASYRYGHTRRSPE